MRGKYFIVGFLFIAPVLLGAGCNIGSLSPLSSSPKDCGGDLVCFESQFKKCAPSSMMNAMAETSGKVTIDGPDGDRCKVTFSVISGKDSQPVITTCRFDKTKTYQENALTLGSISMFKQYCTQTK